LDSSTFTPAHRGGSGPPLVCLHGFLDTHQLRGAAASDAALAMIEHAEREDWSLDAERITCPVRIVWGTEDRLLPWPAAAVRFRTEWLPHADWIELDSVGHCPQLDTPLETAQLILGHTTT
jgi:pimeloyl-ACP methyl ester carboxylesterase